MIDVAHQPCPVCKKTPSNIFHQTTYPEYRYAGTFTMRQCNGCGLLFNSPRLDADELKNLYGKNYYFFARRASSEFKRIVEMYFRTIGRLDESKIQIKCSMDIGCGLGYFPAVLKRLGWDACGIEISPEASQSARNKFDLDIFTGTAEQYADCNKKQFPVVTAIDVIEHVLAPDDFIRAVGSLVEPGGRIIIDTPNAVAANIVSQGILWKGFNPFHIFLFSIENLATLLSQHGFVIEQSFSYNNAQSAMGTREKIIAGMKKNKLLASTARVYFASKRMMTIFDSFSTQHDSKAATKIKVQPVNKCSSDEGPFAATKTGDNIVVIARKL